MDHELANLAAEDVLQEVNDIVVTRTGIVKENAGIYPATLVSPLFSAPETPWSLELQLYQARSYQPK